MAKPLVGVIMGSSSDWATMVHAAETLDALGVTYEVRVLSAHRTPDQLFDYAATAESRGLEIIIAGASGAAHLAGITAAKTLLPVLGVPIESSALHGADSLLSIVQMPAGVPVGTLAIGKPGAVNAALLAEGRLVNLAAAEGRPASAMDMSFATQAPASEFARKQNGRLGIAVHNVPKSIEDWVAKLKLESMGIAIDKLTAEQAKYMKSFDEGM